MMRWPNPHARAMTVMMLGSWLLAGCAHFGEAIDPSKPGAVADVGPTYQFHDNAQTHRRVLLQEYLGLAYNRILVGAYDQAKPLIAKALRLDADSPEALTMLGMVDIAEGRTQQAGDHYRKAVALAPKRGEFLNNYGAWLCSCGHAAEALMWFDRAIADPQYGASAGVLANMGSCALQTGQRERAERDLRRALAQDPNNALALETMARSLHQRQRYFDARAFNERRLSVAPATTSVLQLAIAIERELGDKAAADRYQQQLIKETSGAASVDSKGKVL